MINNHFKTAIRDSNAHHFNSRRSCTFTADLLIAPRQQQSLSRWLLLNIVSHRFGALVQHLNIDSGFFTWWVRISTVMKFDMIRGPFLRKDARRDFTTTTWTNVYSTGGFSIMKTHQTRTVYDKERLLNGTSFIYTTSFRRRGTCW